MRAFPGPHSITNYAYIVDLPEGLRILHSGDSEHFSVVMWNAEGTRVEEIHGLKWVDDLANEAQVDIAFAHIGAVANTPREAITIPVLANRHEKMPLGRPLSETALKPRTIVPMHVNEFGHGLAWISTNNLHLAYEQSDELSSPATQVVVLGWGQRILLTRRST